VQNGVIDCWLPQNIASPDSAPLTMTRVTSLVSLGPVKPTKRGQKILECLYKIEGFSIATTENVAVEHID